MRLPRIIGVRLLVAIPILFGISIAAFALVLLLPGEPARTLAGGDHATPEAIASVRDELGLDDPLAVQYVRWLGDAARLDFGSSLVDGQPVRDRLLTAMPPTLSIALFAVVSGLLIGLAAGTTAGARPGTVVDKLGIALATVGVSVPSFIVAIVLIRVLAVEWQLFPSVRYVNIGESFTGWLRSIVLPGVSLGLLSAGALSRQLRSGLVSAVDADYVRTAWAVGSGRGRALGKHALRNSAIPAVAVFGSQMTFVFGGTVVIERLFAIEGVGTYMYRATLAADLPAIRAVILWFAVVQIAVYLLVDVALSVLNPRLAIR